MVNGIVAGIDAIIFE